MKKWTAAGLAAAMLCGSLGSVAHGQPLTMTQMSASAMAAQQADNQAGTAGVSKHWADAVLSKWKEAGVFSGYEDGTLQPDRLISRAELATLLERILGLSQESSAAGGASEFSDVAATAWYYNAVMEARQAGIIEGYEDGSFRPEQTVSREDAAVMLARAFQLAGLGTDGSEGSSTRFTDAGQLKPYARDVVDLLAAWGMLSGYEDGSFRPERGISRGETATILSRVGGELYHQAGTYDTAETLAHAVINTRDVVLRNKTVTGNLFLAQGIGDGDITVEKSKVAGNLLALGSGQGVRLIDSTVERLVLHRSATVELSGTTEVEELVLGGHASAIVIEGKGKIARVRATDSGITVNGQALQPGEEWTWSGNGKLEKAAAEGTTEGEEGAENQGSPGGNGGTGGAGGSWGGGGAAPGSGGTDHGQSGVWLPAATPGVIPGTVKVSAPLAEGHDLAVRIGHRPIAEPTVGAVLPKDSLTVYPYRAGDDISGVDSEVNKYLGIYEVDGEGKIVRFRSVTLTASAIRPETWRAVWQDEFDSANIDASKWNFVQGANGYGNNELQNYTNRPDNARVEDGELVIEAREDNYDGTRYSSAKLTTEGKGAWTYGKYEIRAKMPSGQGIWPALWMMPSDSKLYSAWPASGEIDIMELLGHEPGKLYGTLHFGTPHQQSQGSYTLPDNGSFADDYHTYGIEWEPGEVRYYVDGILYYKANDWFSKSNQEGGKYTYPAPFDRDFFLQMNVAVGGDWPGDPDASTVFPQQMRIDYVRVYEREGGVYREPALPAEPVIREPAADGNYIVNGSFDDSTVSWTFQPFAPPADLFGGVGSVSLDQGAVKTTIEQEGRETYAVQLVQSEVPIAKDATYQLSFDAWSTEARTMDVAISGPDRNYVRYMKDETINLTSQSQSFQFTFTSDVDTDPNARLEFNMGKAGTSPVWIDQVKLIKLAGPDESHQQAPLPDGNLIYNGSFDQGTDRMGFWSIGGTASATAQASVGSALTERKLTVRPATAGQPEDLVLGQGHLSLSPGKLYLLSFDAAVTGDAAPIDVSVGTTAQPALYADQSFTIGTQMSSHSMMFTAGPDAATTAGLLQFKLGSLASALTLDNVALKEMKPPVAVDGIKRLEAEDFSAMQGVQKGEDGLSVGWIDPGDWMQYIIDVKQADTYTISYFVSSGYEGGGSLTLLAKQGSIFTGDLPAGEISRADADRAYEMDVANTGDWGSFLLVNQEVELDAGIQTLQLYAPHVNVDYMILTAHNYTGATGNLIRNGAFDTDVSQWFTYQSDQLAISAENGMLKVVLPALTPEPWNQQVYQEGIPLVQGQTYTVTFDAYSTVDRPIEMGLGSIDASNNYQYTDFLNGSKPRFWLTGVKQQYQFSFEMTHPSETNSKLEFDLGQYVVGDTVYDTPGTLYLDNIQLHSTVVE